MPLDHSIVGVPSEPRTRNWGADQVILYALGVGAGAENPADELSFTTENSHGVTLQALPTFVVPAIGVGPGRKFGDFDMARLVHAEQGFRLHAPLPTQATVNVTSVVTGMHDKGSGALVTSETTAHDAETGTLLATTTSGLFIRGEGGFGDGSAPAKSAQWEVPDSSPDAQLRYRTRPDQALLYRLSGDRNPLHSDPTFAGRANFPRPILHGLCTYGFTGRALLHMLCGTDPERFVSMNGRFSRPVMPGDELIISAWNIEPGRAHFRTATPDGTIVLDRGVVEFR